MLSDARTTPAFTTKSGDLHCCAPPLPPRIQCACQSDWWRRPVENLAGADNVEFAPPVSHVRTVQVYVVSLASIPRRLAACSGLPVST
jgi:hypothetical protein